MKKNKGITLIALVTTIVVLIILAGVVLNLILGENGIFNKAEEAKRRENETSAREKIEVVLVDARIEKETNTSYNKQQFLDNMLEESGITVEDDIVIFNNYSFMIDREKLEIVESLGETLIKLNTQIQSYLGANENGKYEVSVLLTIESNTELQSVVITNPDGTTSEVVSEGGQATKSLEIELDGIYTIITTTVDGKVGTRKLIEKSVENIRSAEELAEFRDKVNSGLTYEGKTINLLKDIDLSSVCGENIEGEKINWEPIGISEPYFKGTFEGNNHTISNLYINGATKQYQGLFGINKGNIQNLTLDKANVTTSVDNTGILLASNNAGTNVSRITIKGKLSSTGTYHIGCVAAYNSGFITECKNYATISTSGYAVGGIAGVNGHGATISNSCNFASITTSSHSVGGISGRNLDKCLINNSYNRGDITSTGRDGDSHSLCGGISGTNTQNSTIQNCYNTGDVKGSYAYVGGIVGYNGNSSAGTQVVKNVWNTGKIKMSSTTASSSIGKSSSYVGYFIGRYGSLSGKYGNTNQSTMSGWDSETITTNISDAFTNDIKIKVINEETGLEEEVWKNNDGYPILKWQIEK